MRSGGTTWSQAKGLQGDCPQCAGYRAEGPWGKSSVEWSLISAPEGLHFQLGRGCRGWVSQVFRVRER